MQTLEQLMLQTAEMVRPPERLTVSEAATKYRYLNNPGSYVGPWKNEMTPYLVKPMDVLTSTQYRSMIFVGPAQCGKTDMLLNYIAFSAKCDPADMMLVQTAQATARDFSKRRVQRLFRHSPLVGAAVAPGRQNKNTYDIHFSAGWMLTLSWPTINELSGKPIPRLWLTDYDRMDQDVDGEGSPFDLAAKRATTFARYGMCAAESSPGFVIEDPNWLPSTPHEAPPTQGILSLYNRGDRHRWYWRCPHCQHSFEPDFTLLTWPESKDIMECAEAAHLPCPHCGGVIYHDTTDGVPGKYELNMTGDWIADGMKWMPDGTIAGEPRRTEVASFWLKGVAAAFTDWKTLVLKYLSAKEEFERTNNEESLKTTTNTDQGLPYLPKSLQNELLPEELKSRAQDLGERVVPDGVRFLVATIDVQASAFVVQVHGFGVGGDVWIVDRFRIYKSKRLDEDGERYPVNPGGYPEDWHLLLDEVLLKTYPLADGSGRQMQIKAVACDSGGRAGVTPNAYNFWRYLRDEGPSDSHLRFQLVKGDPLPNAPRVQVRFPDSERKDRHAGARGDVPVLHINSNTLKDQVSGMLTRKDPGGGCVNFPKWLPDWFYTELTVERRTPKGWENPRKLRNESWDLLVYAVAISLSRIIRIEHMDWSNPESWAAPWDINDLVSTSDLNKRFAEKPKGDYDLAKLAEQLA